MLVAFNITLRKFRDRNCARKIWMLLTFTSLKLYAPNANIYTGHLWKEPILSHALMLLRVMSDGNDIRDTPLIMRFGAFARQKKNISVKFTKLPSSCFVYEEVEREQSKMSIDTLTFHYRLFFWVTTNECSVGYAVHDPNQTIFCLYFREKKLRFL